MEDRTYQNCLKYIARIEDGLARLDTLVFVDRGIASGVVSLEEARVIMNALHYNPQLGKQIPIEVNPESPKQIPIQSQ